MKNKLRNLFINVRSVVCKVVLTVISFASVTVPTSANENLFDAGDKVADSALEKFAELYTGKLAILLLAVDLFFYFRTKDERTKALEKKSAWGIVILWIFLTLATETTLLEGTLRWFTDLFK